MERYSRSAWCPHGGRARRRHTQYQWRRKSRLHSRTEAGWRRSQSLASKHRRASSTIESKGTFLEIKLALNNRVHKWKFLLSKRFSFEKKYIGNLSIMYFPFSVWGTFKISFFYFLCKNLNLCEYITKFKQ